MQQTKKEILKRKVSFELGLISLLSVSLFFMLQIVNVEAYGSSIYSVLTGDADSTSPSAQEYTLTVTNGTGSGSYVESAKVAITANPAISEKVFDKWTGDTEYIADVNAATTTVTMPARAITLVASYETSPSAEKYVLTVKKGTGSGSYIEGSKITITANPAISERVFIKWTGDTKYVADATSATATVTMPARAITLVANYKTVPSAKKYALSVKNGTGSGSYIRGTHVTITANPAISERVFSKWTGNTKYISDPTAATTTVTMPAKAVRLVANYKTVPSVGKYVLTVKNGTGSGSYAEGSKATISANVSISEKVFDKWTGDTEYIADVNAATTTVTMPAKSVTIVATYKTSPSAEKYVLTVKKGTGSGSYAKGAKVTIVAAAVPAGKVFNKWTGDTKYVADATSATTIVTMPEKAVVLVANYKTISAAPSLRATVTSADVRVDKGVKNVTLIEAALTNTGTETLSVSGLGIMADYGDNSVNNVKLYLDEKDMGSPAKTKIYEVIYKSLPLQIEAGKTVKLVLKGDISANMKLKGLGFRLDSCTNVFTVKGATTNKRAKLSVSGKSYLYFTAAE